MSTIQETSVLSKIRSRGHWRVVIRPTIFRERRISDYSELFPIVEKNSVQLRGRVYPHVDHSTLPRTGEDWVGQEYDHDDVIEVWRLYLSGQFAHSFAIAGEWRDQSTFWPADPGWKPGRVLHYLNVIDSLVKVFEFAARLALSSAGDARMHVDVAIHNLTGRQLITTDIRVVLPGLYRTDAGKWSYIWEDSQTELIATPRKLAAKAARDLFTRFGLNVSLETLNNLQELVGRQQF